ncbi:DUF6230 family protein [Laceyella putida]|uniref:DUF6230 family protein n=1 Tax=Laceyella putida TaxID=110101 RepID=A0ABW2RI78_9BACL
MRYRGKRFWSSMVVALCLVFALVMGIWTGGVALAVPIGGIGGFVIEADEIQISNFNLLPKIGETSERAAYPQGSVQLDGVIKNLKLYKELDVPGKEKVRVLITASKDVKASGMVLDLSKLQADASFNKLKIAEKYSNDWQGKFGLSAPRLVLEKPFIQGHYLFANSISLPGLSLQLEILAR